MSTQVIEDKPASEAEVKALALKSKVDALAVIDQASYDAANSINAEAYRLKKAFHEWFDPIDDASKKQRQATIAQGKKIDEPFDYVIEITGDRCSKWIEAAKEKAEDEKRKAEAIARKIADDAALKTAQALQDAGLQSAAEEVLSAPVVVARVEVAGPVKAKGTYYPTLYSAEVSDLMALVKSVAEGKTPICYLQANETALNGWARSTKGAEAMPGVRIVKTTTQGRR